MSWGGGVRNPVAQRDTKDTQRFTESFVKLCAFPCRGVGQVVTLCAIAVFTEDCLVPKKERLPLVISG